MITNNDKWNAFHFLCRFYMGDNIVEIIKMFLKHSTPGTRPLYFKNAAGYSSLLHYDDNKIMLIKLECKFKENSDGTNFAKSCWSFSYHL